MDRRISPSALIAPELLRAARAVLNWSLVEASQVAGASVSAVLSAERKRPRSAPVPTETLDRLQGAYERAGIHFFQTSAGERGIQIARS